ncbi:MAG: hypothetical protein ABH865_01690 [Candidatus Omnitrophota bacterium]
MKKTFILCLTILFFTNFSYAETEYEKGGIIVGIISKKQPIAIGEQICSDTVTWGIIKNGEFIGNNSEENVEIYTYEGIEDNEVIMSTRGRSYGYLKLPLNKDNQAIWHVSSEADFIISVIDKEKNITVKLTNGLDSWKSIFYEKDLGS